MLLAILILILDDVHPQPLDTSQSYTIPEPENCYYYDPLDDNESAPCPPPYIIKFDYI